MNTTEALQGLPARLREGLLAALAESDRMAVALLDRGAMKPLTAVMAGLALDPAGRPMLERAIEEYAQTDRELPTQVDEVVIGGGAHAAIWAATRARFGVTPLVLDKGERFGGTFAMTQNSSFFLNSRNRPGRLGAPGSRDALNIIPGAPMQPSDLGGFEYQANADLGLVVRCTLALNATVRRAKVKSVTRNDAQWVVSTDRGIVRTKRVIVATGLGIRKQFVAAPADGEKILTFEDLMRRFDKTTFPLRDLGRVAVVGAGDSGRTAIEALTGYGPFMGGSVASVDYLDRIDWYGVGDGMTKDIWLKQNRTRYKAIAALFPSAGARNARVRGLKKCEAILKTYDGLLINGESYDSVVCCFSFNTDLGGVDVEGLSPFLANRGKISEAPLGLANTDASLFVVGPAANLGFDKWDAQCARTEENRVALFRLAPRTSALATLLTPA